MTKKVLDVGQCFADHHGIKDLIESNLDAQVYQADSHASTMESCQREQFDLILVNRVLDADGSPGMEVLTALKQDVDSQAIPVMLVSNYHDAQTSAIEAGAIPGFGKSSLKTAATLDLIKNALGLI